MADFFAFLLSYETLRVIWWLFIGILLIGFAITDGFDLGVGTLLPFLGRNDEERRVIINVVGPTWEGNQVWFILGGGAVFAAWPPVYATAFSGFFIALILTLFAMILRPVGFDYRSKLPNPSWRKFWDWGLFVGGAVPALVFGVAFGNLLLGVPFHFDADLRAYYTGGFLGLLNPFGLLAGIVSLSMLVMHGAVYLQLRTEGEIQQRARWTVTLATLLFLVAFALAGVWMLFWVDGYRLESFAGTAAPSNPLAKTVVRDNGALLARYAQYPWMLVAPCMGFGGAILAWLSSLSRRPGFGFIASSLALAGVILTAGFSLFPFIMPSSSDPNSSLTVWDATSSHLTLKWMFGVTLVFLPIVLAYTTWVFGKLRGTVTVAQVRAADKVMY
ncbi:MAG: cytochrome d ubiquinol oxidase subunit II [Candidatus Competibacteraceae bacterium]|nr:cytochrome d ubiquinol oxidase subunit II [Candidatus Competibacteraceae bacterium]